MRTFATTSSSLTRSIAAKTGAVWLETTAGLVLCATTQSGHDADSVRLGCSCVDSAAAVQHIRDRHSHADHRIQLRMFSRFGIRLIPAYNGYPTFGNAWQVTIDSASMVL